MAAKEGRCCPQSLVGDLEDAVAGKRAASRSDGVARHQREDVIRREHVGVVDVRRVGPAEDGEAVGLPGQPQFVRIGFQLRHRLLSHADGAGRLDGRRSRADAHGIGVEVGAPEQVGGRQCVGDPVGDGSRPDPGVGVVADVARIAGHQVGVEVQLAAPEGVGRRLGRPASPGRCTHVAVELADRVRVRTRFQHARGAVVTPDLHLVDAEVDLPVVAGREEDGGGFGLVVVATEVAVRTLAPEEGDGLVLNTWPVTALVAWKWFL